MTRGTVLVVEDNAQLRDIIVGWLADSYAVRIAATGEDAIAEVDNEVDVVLLDRNLPDITGDDVVSLIRDQGFDCRVAMVTAVQPDVGILDLDFDDYLMKPVRKRELHSMVNSLLDRAAFNEKVQKRFALSTKLAALEQEKSMIELNQSKEYTDAKMRLEELSQEIYEIISRSSERNMAEMYYEVEGNSNALHAEKRSKGS